MHRDVIVRTTARVVAGGVFLLLVAGALVTSTESGLAVPDWPLSYGKVMPPMVGGIRFEHGHRLVAAAMSTLVGLQVAVLWWGERRKAVRRLGLLAFGAILLQALLGGLTVLLLLPPAISSAHAALAQIVLALVAAVALMTSPGYSDGSFLHGPANGASLEQAFGRTALAAGAVFAQIVVGAVMRHTGAGLAVPDFPRMFGRLVPSLASLSLPGVPIHLAHRLGAVVVAVLVLRAAASLRRLDRTSTLFGHLGAFWVVALALQIGLGALSIWSRKEPALTAAHLVVGALCWVAGVLAALALSRARQLAAAPTCAAVQPTTLSTVAAGSAA